MPDNDKARDRRLRKTYGISLAEYNDRMTAQNGGCGICHKVPEPGKKSLAVDHCHRVRYFKVTLTKGIDGGWVADIPELGSRRLNFMPIWGETKREATRNARQRAKKASVRGLLCWRCNTGLQKWRDNPELMESAAKYLRNYYGYQI